MKAKKFLHLLIIIPFFASCTSCNKEDNYINDTPIVSHPIVVIYENDVHCAVDGYAKLATIREQQKALTPYVTTVSCGDFIQGDVVGAISTGGHIIDIMNQVNYDFVTLGNHEFDFGLPRMFELTKKLNAQVVDANFRHIQTNTPVFPAYEIVTYENVDIAYIGLTTTSTLSGSSKKFQDENGAFIYDFSKNTFYETAQSSINQARQEGADYVIVLSHLGEELDGDHPNSHSLIAQTTGIDVVLDAHSHNYLPDTLIYNEAGQPVLMSSTGSKFQGVGILTLSPEGTFSTRIESLENVAPDAGIQAFVDDIKTKVENEGNIVIGHNEVALPTHTPMGIRMVRDRETTIGNFCADAFRNVLDTDIAFINGGGIRDSINRGEVTFNDLKAVFPFGNTASIGSMTGWQLLDVLEFSVSQLPNESGEFLHVSGMKFEADASIPSPVLTDETGLYAGVDDTARRVSNVQILNKEGAYEPIDLNRTYTIAGFNYHLLDGGGQGILNGANIIASDMGQDIEILSIYMQQYLEGKIDQRYAETEGRILITGEACLEEMIGRFPVTLQTD